MKTEKKHKKQNFNLTCIIFLLVKTATYIRDSADYILKI